MNWVILMVNILCQWCDKPIVTIGCENYEFVQACIRYEAENILIKIHVKPMICPECAVKYVVNELKARKEVMWK